MQIPSPQAVVDAIIAVISDRLDHNISVAEHAAASATHEEARAEDKYDTRGLEMSYLAAGASDRAETLRVVLMNYRGWRRPPVDPQHIAPGALIGLEDDDGNERVVFLAPFGDGERVVVDGITVQGVTLKAPLGEALHRRGEGEEISIVVAGQRRQWAIEKVC